MTLLEAIQSNATFMNISLETIKLMFLNRGIEISDDYNVGRKKDLELVSADLYLELATMPEFREGELTIKHERDILMRRARNIYVKYGDEKVEETGYIKLEIGIKKLQ